MENQGKFDTVLLNINIDGAGYKGSKSAFSFFGLPDIIKRAVSEIMAEHPDIIESVQWPQGDHSIFVENGRPAIAVSSQWFVENINSQDVTHTPKDNLGIVDFPKLVDIAEAINELVRRL
jgi:aminopeptidase YwaD